MLIFMLVCQGEEWNLLQPKSKLKLKKNYNNPFSNILLRVAKLQQLQKEMIQCMLKKKLQHQ